MCGQKEGVASSEVGVAGTCRLFREGSRVPAGLGGRLFCTVLSIGVVLGTPKSVGGKNRNGERKGE